MPAFEYPLEDSSLCTCASCRRVRDEPGDWRECQTCDQAYDYNREGDFYHCSSCEEDDTSYDEYDEYDDANADGEYLRSYNWSPYALNFLSADGSDPDRDKLHLGIELEVPTDYSGEFAQVVHDGPGKGEEVLFCKEDGSIDGVEIVTHPMTHRYFREQFPFAIFEDDSRLTGLLRQRTPGEGYGLHVHVSRDGFVSESHTLRWLLLIYGNSEKITELARRGSSEWTSFRDVDACEEKARQHKSAFYGDRYVAVNACNEATFEVRVFRSTWNEQQFRAAVDLVHASVTYTRKLKALEALKGDGLSWEKFGAWVATRPEYRNLAREMGLDVPEGDEPADDTNGRVWRLTGAGVARFAALADDRDDVWCVAFDAVNAVYRATDAFGLYRTYQQAELESMGWTFVEPVSLDDLAA